MKTLRFDSSSLATPFTDVIRRLYSTYHKRNCYPARADVHALVLEARSLRGQTFRID